MLMIARKFPSTQIQLSLSIPASLTSASGPSLDPFASKTLLIMEKQLGVWLGEVLAGEQS
jgi:proteasome assembly chaperone 4